jgi:hypothetical protein
MRTPYGTVAGLLPGGLGPEAGTVSALRDKFLGRT